MSSTKFWRFTTVVVAAAVALAACGSDDSLEGDVVSDGIGCQQRAERNDRVPTVEADAKAAEATEVARDDVTEGDGCPTDTESFLTLDLIGATTADGKVFTNTWESGRPITARLGTGQLIAGLEAGLTEMKVGGRRTITIPADQAYGAEGNAAQGIGPDQALTFVVDLRGVTREPLFCNEAAPLPAGARPGKPETVEMPAEAPAELVTEDVEPGDGAEVEQDAYVTVEYVGVACSTGQQFESTWDEGGQAASVGLGGDPAAAGLTRGLAQGLVGAKVGGLRRIEVPSSLGYGASGPVAPNEALVYLARIVEARGSEGPTECVDAEALPAGTREGKPSSIDLPDAPPTEVVTTDLEPGDGATVADDAYVTVEYVGVTCSSGEQFDSSWDREEALTVAIGQAPPTEEAIPVIPGWSNGLTGAKVGALRQIDIPAELAYGAEGRPPSIGPNEPLTFVVRIVDTSEPE